jgi:hypothetical protein
MHVMLLTDGSLAEPSLPGIITAIAATITAIGGLIVSLFVLIPSLRIQKTTHALVNQQHTDLTNYQRMLIATLKAHDIAIPVDQSAPEVAIEENTA